ncbi:MAG TPA: TIGR04053 family radical SAM/SPASM domain-containing protein [Bryobacteraceae bacterium]|nr:TIGR04053 family radical SAM/SPASM domain-containing protein [Bryobacteraceae bacterium]HOQ44478.1 TIGR04053 family radical SAM/SPASM domain-containing protein [Bryobacteraceae bacterium]HPQ16159.1 TIGR04053 family radical SAM/SPASM domain-containing protein [Bryobacteraceae bacterium]HPU70797.1 TIGR04053 family radical SAM/SPASM domain-containing protein [Bryobacteraceae bacterium]
MRNFDEAPFLVIWEVTRACDLACVHCRASADPVRHPLELTTEEGFRLLETIREFGDPIMIFTGGDPLKRPDLFQLLEKSVQLGLRTTLSPSPTPLLTADAIAGFKRVGVARISISVDGWDAASHDNFRQVPGSFDRAIFALEEARRIGLSTQINTTVSRHNYRRLGEIADLVDRTGSDMWDVFFLVPTGRGASQQELNAEEFEEVFNFLYERSKTSRAVIKTTEAMHYRRYLMQRRKAEGGSNGKKHPGDNPLNRMAGINSGRGFVFISRTGEIYPSGFLPISSGNVRRHSLVDVYRNGALFRVLRDSSCLKGKCGLCQYRNLCGGSRSRAYALTGDYLAEEPRCIHQP